MSTTTTDPVSLPPGARPDIWQDDVPMPYRVLLGEVRGIDGVGLDRVSVQPTAVQFADGRVNDGSVHEAPRVYLGGDGLTSAQARELAAVLLEVAAQLDVWGVKRRPPQLPAMD